VRTSSAAPVSAGSRAVVESSEGRAAVAAAWLWLGARRAASHGSSPCREREEAAAWNGGPTERASQRLIAAWTRECLSSRRAVISPKRSAISSTARDAPLCDVLAACPDYAVPTIHPGRRRAPTASRRQGIDPDQIASLSVPCKRVLHARHLKCGIDGPASRTDCVMYASARGSLGPTRVCLGPGAVRSPRVQQRGCASDWPASEPPGDPRSRI